MMGSQVSYTTSGLAVGTHTITATYSGDSTYAGVTSAAVTQTVQKITDTVMLGVGGSPSVGMAMTFTASISSGAMTTLAPTGSILFYDNGTLLATVLLGPGMFGGLQAVFTTSTLAAGSHSLTASYAGDDNYMASSTTYSFIVY